MKTLSRPYEAAETYAVFFKNVFSDPYVRESSTSRSSDSLSLATVSGSGVPRKLSTCDLQNPTLINRRLLRYFYSCRQISIRYWFSSEKFPYPLETTRRCPCFHKRKQCVSD
jgi:hypothetical protein